MKDIQWKKVGTIVGILAIFLVVTYTYFSPLIAGKALQQHDHDTYMGMSSEIRSYRVTHDQEALWTNRMFGGMPSYLSGARYYGNKLSVIDDVLRVGPVPGSSVFLTFVGFFFLMMVCGLSPWVSLVASLAFGFSSFYFIILGAGHNTKALAISYMAPVLAGILLTFKGKRWLGAAILGVALGLELRAGHPQMTYYLFLMVVVYGLVELYYHFKDHKLVDYFKNIGALTVFAVLAVLANSSNLASTYEYSPFSIRGKSTLQTEDKTRKEGLDKSYIFDYSYDVGESFTAFIPRLKGGGMSEPLDKDSHLYQAIAKQHGAGQAKQICRNIPLYWGSQPIVSGPFYFGAVLCFLAFFGMFFVKGRIKWWLTITIFIAFLLSLGKNFSLLSDFMVNYFPMYNKFRDVKNIVIIQNLAMAMLGTFAIWKVTKRDYKDGEIEKALKYSVGILGGLCLLLVVIPSISGNFVGSVDGQLRQAGWPANWIQALQDDRRSIVRMDALRSLFFVLVSAAGIWAVWKQKIKGQWAVVLWAALVLIDMWPQDKKYLNDSNFVSKKRVENPYTPSKADKIILQDKSLDYRVLNLSVSTFNDASTSFFHNSIGGYHGAKMRRYQDLIEHQLSKEIQALQAGFGKIKSEADVSKLFDQTPVLNMLNAKYLIYNPKAAPLTNGSAYGNGWVVDQVKGVKDDNMEMAALGQSKLSHVAVMNEATKKTLGKLSNLPLSEKEKVTMTKYDPNELTYEVHCDADRLVVFSEIYYPKGWRAYVDNKEVDIYRVDYLLRALKIGKGTRSVQFKFVPSTYEKGEVISLISSILLLLSLAGMIVYGCKENKKKTEA
ncbi:YfhO family protein [Halosquirtibacter xylanolyticus]|uniref:YfhO family protein n=1 Tax=Halosquirtibacter xylanolyticus TaxID=3374599 RepID=UPI0037491587|nr:YfhO family protein [Prolixibacteraceae bacterium]